MLKKFSWAFASLLIAPLPSQAQGLEVLGNRAAALSAFVAVADDASAVAWNPAGLVSGPIFNVSLDLARASRAPGTPAEQARAGRLGATLVAFGVPPLGAFYYRLDSTAIAADRSAEAATPDRHNRQVSLRQLTTHHLGVTVLQSLGDYLTIGATAKVVRGSVGAGIDQIASWDEGFERARDLVGRGSTAGDIDLGAMFAVRAIRAGLVVRNVTEPTFDAGEAGSAALRLKRHARMGLAWGDRWPGLPRMVVAFDADVTRVAHPGGERRDLAAGVERWLRGQRVALRGGLRASTVGDARPIVTGGGSYAVRAGTYVDVFVARGTSGARGWGIGARVTY